jgi:hypothetical protein
VLEDAVQVSAGILAGGLELLDMLFVGFQELLQEGIVAERIGHCLRRRGLPAGLLSRKIAGPER